MLHLERMEKAQDKSKESHAAGDTKVAGMGCE